ncbi:hypothetical protein KXD93_05700 [Mucilaginibacter sp. BJC16-A38]|uniref:hypothetical protein n=1 Tax=Mucilaginibacter phenanthrenivorans TaxID=1234842 RepID=UPI002157E0F3|nr:hypothetical protein [Mucilaginibacter phenanthrenivorans]MCR8557124.1 hypothetical protein [Mucilaginibacter phenanthrenivorans]
MFSWPKKTEILDDEVVGELSSFGVIQIYGIWDDFLAFSPISGELNPRYTALMHCVNSACGIDSPGRRFAGPPALLRKKGKEKVIVRYFSHLFTRSEERSTSEAMSGESTLPAPFLTIPSTFFT